MSSKSSAACSRQRSSMDATDSSTEGTAPPVPFSRSTGLPAWMGKATSEIKVRVPDCIAEDGARLARECGYESLSVFVRDLLIIRIQGRENVASLHAQRVALVAGMGTERGGQ